MNTKNLFDILQSNQNDFKPVTSFDFKSEPYHVFDFTSNNKELNQLDLNDEEAFTGYVFGELARKQVKVGVGGYGEHRTFYSRSAVFTGEESRSIHLGIDIWAAAGTPVLAPLQGKVHSFANNDEHGDYGPTIILEHELEGCIFYTLYGHLSMPSIEGLKNGKIIAAGQQFAWFGAYHENVHWPPHLHFQLIADIGDYKGDFPGVAKPTEKESWLIRCPDPNIILQIDQL